MKTDYEKIFRHRGESYHKAMVDFPGVRSLEFQQLFAHSPIQEGETIVDCPALGGYLKSNIFAEVEVISIDYCPQSPSVLPLSTLNLKGKKANRAICLAASHHINDLPSFIGELATLVKPKGSLHLADVAHDSSIRYFLDDFVGKWTSTGHNGLWRNLSTEFSSSSYCGVRLVKVEERECPWVFQSKGQMLQFCRLLFGLDLNPTDQKIWEALEEHVGVIREGANWKMQWRLTYVDFTIGN